MLDFELQCTQPIKRRKKHTINRSRECFTQPRCCNDKLEETFQARKKKIIKLDIGTKFEEFACGKKIKKIANKNT